MRSPLDHKIGLKIIWKQNIYEIVNKNELYISLKKIDNNSIYRITQEEFNRDYLNNFIIPFSSSTESFFVDLNSIELKKRKKQ